MKIRLFIASFDDVKIWGNNSERLIKTLEKTDVIFFIQGDQKVTPAKMKLIDKLKKIAEVHITDSDIENQGVFAKKILLEFLKKNEKLKYDLYIVGPSLACIYEDKEEFEEFASSVMKNHNFQVKRLIPKEEKCEDENVQMFMEGIMESEENDPPKKYENKKKVNNSGSAKDSGNAKKKKDTSSLETHRSTVEKSIFGSSIESAEYEEKLTELEEAKACFVDQLKKRTERHIRQFLFQKPSTIVLTNDEFFDFVALMMGSENAKEFIESWQSQHNLDVEMTEETFVNIKPELTFFNVICELLYDRDFWED